MTPIRAVNQHSIPAAMDLGTGLRLARAAGFDAFEPVVRATGELCDSTDDAGVRRVAEGLRAAGLRIFTLSSDAWFRMPLTDPDPAVRRAGLDRALRLVEMTARIGAEVLHVIPGMVEMPLVRPDYGPVPYDDVMSRARDAVASLARKAESEGVRIGIENVWNGFLMSPLEMRELVLSSGSPAVGALFDIGNCIRFGSPPHWIRILRDRLFRVHFKDYRRAAGNASGFVPPLMGDVPWPAVMSALEEAGYAGPMAVEVAAGGLDPATHLALLARSLDQLAALLSRG